MNIALVVLDTLRKDAFDEHFDWLEGVRYDNAWSPTHWTVPAHASLFTGLYGSETGVHAKSQVFDYPGPVLAEQLQDAGYTTRAYSANVNVSSPFDFDRGFTEFTGNWRIRGFREDLFDWGRFIKETTDEGMGAKRFPLGVWRCVTEDCATLPSLKHGLLLKARDLDLGRFVVADDGATEARGYVRDTAFAPDGEFLFVNLMEAHTPYDPPGKYSTVDLPKFEGLRATLEGNTAAEPDDIRTAYHDAVRYLSDRYREIHADLLEAFDLVITLSDHGEMLGEYDAWEHVCGLYPELTHVPLTISGAGADDLVAPDGRLVTLFDVYRTVCDAADIDPAGNARGHTLFEEVRDDELLTEYHGMTDRQWSVLSNAGIDRDRLEAYDREFHGVVVPDAYAFEHPTGELEQIGDGRIKDPAGRIEGLVESLDRRDAGADVDVAPAVERQLEDLGYG